MSAKIQERKEQKERQEKWNQEREVRRPVREQAQKQEQKSTVSHGTRRIYHSREQPTVEKAQEKKSFGEEVRDFTGTIALVILVLAGVTGFMLGEFLPFQVENWEMRGGIFSGTTSFFGLFPKNGRIIYPNGNVYDGGWNTYPEGEGVYILADGTRYEGDWNTGRLVEDVTETDGKKLYHGIHLSSDGAAYIGTWTETWFTWNRTGQGTMYYADGDTYTGAWENDAITGYGTYTWTNGDRYEGNFADDQMDGQGTFYDVDGTQTTGTWQEGGFMG